MITLIDTLYAECPYDSKEQFKKDLGRVRKECHDYEKATAGWYRQEAFWGVDHEIRSSLAGFFYSVIKQPAFVDVFRDDDEFVDYARLLVRCGEYKEAISFLRVYSYGHAKQKTDNPREIYETSKKTFDKIANRLLNIFGEKKDKGDWKDLRNYAKLLYQVYGPKAVKKAESEAYNSGELVKAAALFKAGLKAILVERGTLGKTKTRFIKTSGFGCKERRERYIFYGDSDEKYFEESVRNDDIKSASEIMWLLQNYDLAKELEWEHRYFESGDFHMAAWHALKRDDTESAKRWLSEVLSKKDYNAAAKIYRCFAEHKEEEMDYLRGEFRELEEEDRLLFSKFKHDESGVLFAFYDLFVGWPLRKSLARLMYTISVKENPNHKMFFEKERKLKAEREELSEKIKKAREPFEMKAAKYKAKAYASE